MQRRYANHLIQQLRAERHRQGISLDAFEAKTGMKAVRIGSYERGDRAARPESLIEWAGHLGLDVVLVPKGQPVGLDHRLVEQFRRMAMAMAAKCDEVLVDAQFAETKDE